MFYVRSSILHWKCLPFYQPPFISPILSPCQSLVHPLFPWVWLFLDSTLSETWSLCLSLSGLFHSLSRMPFDYVKNRFYIKLSVLLLCVCVGGAFLCSFIEVKVKAKVKVNQSCLNLCELMDCCLPGSSGHGILQTKMLEWLAILFSRGSSQPRDRTQFSCISDWFFTIWATREAQVRYFMLNVLY